MESKKINQLATELAPDLSDLTIIGDPTTGISKKITLSQMASLFTGTVEEYATLAAFPLVGVADTIYIALDTNVIYRYDTSLSAYVILSPNIINSLVFSDANGFDGTITLVGSVATLSITTALTLGSVPFIGASGALTQDNANLFFDDTNNRLGIATASPTTPLDVFGSGIIGRLNATSTNNAYLGFASNGTNKWSAGNVQSDHRFRIFSEANSAELITILQTGEFGIGISNPTTKFHIDGAATALIANLDANISVAKTLSFRSDNSNRINLEVSGTESGSNAGADFFLRTYTDLGALIETPFQITRSTGLTTLKNVAITGLTTSYLPKANGSSALIDSLFFDDGTYAGIRASNPILYTINSSQKNWNSADNIGYFDQRIEDTSSAGARTVSFIRSVVSAGVSSGITVASDLTFGTAAYDATATEKMRITNSGNILIGTTIDADYATLQVQQTYNSGFGGIRLANTLGNWWTTVVAGNTNYYFNYQGTGVAYITSTGAATFSSTISAGVITGDSNSTGVPSIIAKVGSGGNSGTYGFGGNTDYKIRGGSDYAAMIFDTAGSERMRITSGGDVLVNKTSATNTGKFELNYSRNDNVGMNLNDTTATAGCGHIYFQRGGTNVGSITSPNNSSTAFNTSSDYRLKEDLQEINGLEKTLAIKVYNFKWKNEEDRSDGVLAHELAEILPYAVNGEKDAIDEKDNIIPQGVDYSKIVPILVKAIQEQQAQIEELKELINK